MDQGAYSTLESAWHVAIPHQHCREPQDDGSTPPFDGTAEMYWPDLESFRSALASPEGVLAGKDTERFASSVELMVVDEWVVRS